MICLTFFHNNFRRWPPDWFWIGKKCLIYGKLPQNKKNSLKRNLAYAKATDGHFPVWYTLWNSCIFAAQKSTAAQHTCAKLLNVSQHVHKFSPLKIRRPYERRVLEKLSIVAGDPGLEFRSAEFVFGQQSQTCNETSTAPITFLHELEVKNWDYKNKLRVGYYHCDSSTFNAIRGFNQHRNAHCLVTFDDLKHSALLSEFMWLPNTAPPSDVVAIEHICIELIHSAIWLSSSTENSSSWTSATITNAPVTTSLVR